MTNKHTSKEAVSKTTAADEHAFWNSTPAFRMDNPVYDGLDVSATNIILHNPTYDADITLKNTTSLKPRTIVSQPVTKETHEYDYPSVTVPQKQRASSPAHLYEPIGDSEPLNINGSMQSAASGDSKKVEGSIGQFEKKKPMMPPKKKNVSKKINEMSLHYLDNTLLKVENSNEKRSSDKDIEHMYAVLEPDHMQDLDASTRLEAKAEHTYAVLEGPVTESEKGSSAFKDKFFRISEHYEVSSKYLESSFKL